MTPALAPVVLMAIAGGMIALPLAPAILEVIQRRDAGPLPTRKDEGHIRSFAQALRRYIEPLQSQLAECADRGTIEECRLPDGAYALLVGQPGIYEVPEEQSKTLILFAKPVSLRDQMIFAKDLYTADVLRSGRQNIFRAVLADKDVILAEESQVMRWLHANGIVILGRNSAAFGRLSADGAVRFSSGCGFQRVNAPTVMTMDDALQPLESQPAIARSLQIQESKLGRSRIRGEIHLGPNEMFLGNIIATGAVRIDEGTRIAGSAKGHKQIHLGERAEVGGSLVSTGDIRMGPNCLIRGPVLADGEIYIGSGTQIGAPGSPTTVSAPRIRVAPGCSFYGTLWARVSGRVEN